MIAADAIPMSMGTEPASPISTQSGGSTTKSKKTRTVPISTPRLDAVLRWLRVDAAGEEKPAETQVFSDETGDPYRIIRKSWVLTVLRARDW